jgi:hypothetical protein
MEMVKHDLVQRKVNVRRMGDLQMWNTLEEILREEEEKYGHLIMYRVTSVFVTWTVTPTTNYRWTAPL